MKVGVNAVQRLLMVIIPFLTCFEGFKYGHGFPLRIADYTSHKDYQLNINNSIKRVLFPSLGK